MTTWTFDVARFVSMQHGWCSDGSTSVRERAQDSRLSGPRGDHQKLMTPAWHGKIVEAVAARDPRAAGDGPLLDHVRDAPQLITQSLIPELAPRPSEFVEIRSGKRQSRPSRRGAGWRP